MSSKVTGFLDGLKTHVTGTGAIILSLLVGFKVITPDVADAAPKAVVDVITQIGALVLAIQGLVAIFQRLAIKKETQKAVEAAKQPTVIMPPHTYQ